MKSKTIRVGKRGLAEGHAFGIVAWEDNFNNEINRLYVAETMEEAMEQFKMDYPAKRIRSVDDLGLATIVTTSPLD